MAWADIGPPSEFHQTTRFHRRTHGKPRAGYFPLGCVLIPTVARILVSKPARLSRSGFLFVGEVERDARKGRRVQPLPPGGWRACPPQRPRRQGLRYSHQPGRDRLQSPPPAHLALRVPESTGGSALSFRPPCAPGAWAVFLCRPTLLSRLPHALCLGRGFGRCGRDFGIGRS
jgi:hypothetical protein